MNPKKIDYETLREQIRDLCRSGSTIPKIMEQTNHKHHTVYLTIKELYKNGELRRQSNANSPSTYFTINSFIGKAHDPFGLVHLRQTTKQSSKAVA